MDNTMKTLIISSAILISIYIGGSLVFTEYQQLKIESFIDKCQQAGGFTTQVDMGFKARIICSVTKLNHF